MQSKKLAGSKPSSTTQRYLDIAEIKEDVVVLKDGTMRAVLICSSINFALKSVDEQQAIIQAYMQFLNAIDFPLQILIQSRRLNIDGYLAQLKNSEETQTNELLKAQIRDYHAFVSELVSLGNIMSKRFFIVVPFDPLSNKQKGWFSRFKEALTPTLSVRLKEERFQQRKTDLMQRVNMVSSLVASMGIQPQMVDTQGLIELFYTVYNPKIFDVQKMKPIGEIRLDE